MLVKDRMSVPPITIRPDADYKAALALMQEHAVHHVPVLGADGALVGILAERDLLLAAMHYLQSDVDVGTVMHRNVVTVGHDQPIEQAATLLSRHKIGGLPVVARGGEVIGMITETDLLAAFVDLVAGKPRRLASRSRAKPRPAMKAPVKRTLTRRRSVKAK